jgi:hypothetical protein
MFSMIFQLCVLLRIWGLHDLKDRFWIWWSNLLDLFIQALHKSLFHLLPTGHSTGTLLTSNWTELSTRLNYHSTVTHCNSLLLYIVMLVTSHYGPHQKHRSQEYPACSPVRYLEMDLCCLLHIHWNMFTEPLHSSRSIRHNIMMGCWWRGICFP